MPIPQMWTPCPCLNYAGVTSTAANDSSFKETPHCTDDITYHITPPAHCKFIKNRSWYGMDFRIRILHPLQCISLHYSTAPTTPLHCTQYTAIAVMVQHWCCDELGGQGELWVLGKLVILGNKTPPRDVSWYVTHRLYHRKLKGVKS